MKLKVALASIIFWGLQCPAVAAWITWWPASWDRWGIFYLTELSIITALIGAVIYYDQVKNGITLRDLDKRTDIKVNGK